MVRFTEKLKDGKNIIRKGIQHVFCSGVGTFFDGEAVDKLAEYEDLEEQGKLLKLPCAIGDLLYEPQINTGMVEEYIVIHICYTCECEIFLGSKLNSEIYSKIKGIYIGEIGKTVFRTKEEAEAALKKMNETEE